MQIQIFKKRQGFSLMETVIALGVVALLLTSFLSVFGPAANNIRKAISSEDAERLASALEAELNTNRSTATYSSAFDSAFEHINGSDAPGGFLVLYNYRASSNNGSSSAGIIDEASNDDAVDPDQKVILQSAVRRLNYANLANELATVEGPVFIARLTQLVYDQNGALKPVFVATEDGSADTVNGNGITGVPNTAGTIYNPSNDGTSRTFIDDNGDGKLSDDYPDAAIAFQAKFYLLNATSHAYITQLQGEGLIALKSSTGNPIFTRNMAVRR